MYAPRKIETCLTYVVLALLALMLLMQIIAARGLFADGAYYLLYMLDKNSFFIFDEKSRLFVRLVTQTPTMAALWLGVTDITTLRTLFCASISGAPILLWVLALYKTRYTPLFWLMLGLFCLVYFSTCFFAVGEYNFSFALSAAAFAILMQDYLNARDKILLALIATLSIMSYPSSMFFGVLFTVIAIYRATTATRTTDKFYWLMLTACFVASAGVGLWGYLSPGIPFNKAGAKDIRALLYDRQIALVVTGLTLAGLQVFIKSRTIKDILCFLALCCGLIAFTGMWQSSPFMDYAVRGYVGAGFAGCCIISALFKFYGHRFPKFLNPKYFQTGLHIALPVFTIFTALCLWDMLNSIDYKNYVAHFERVVNDNSGYLPSSRIAIVDLNDRLYGWSWTYPTMSLLLRRDAQGAIILNPAYGVPHQPYDPLTALPDLSRYYH